MFGACVNTTPFPGNHTFGCAFLSHHALTQVHTGERYHAHARRSTNANACRNSNAGFCANSCGSSNAGTVAITLAQFPARTRSAHDRHG